MRVFMSSDGFVLCSLEDKNRAFLQDCYLLFKRYKSNNLFLPWFTEAKSDWAYPEVGEIEDYKSLSEIIKNAEKHNIPVEKEVYDCFEKLKAVHDRNLCATGRRKRAGAETGSLEDSMSFRLRKVRSFTLGRRCTVLQTQRRYVGRAASNKVFGR